MAFGTCPPFLGVFDSSYILADYFDVLASSGRTQSHFILTFRLVKISQKNPPTNEQLSSKTFGVRFILK